LSRAPTSITAPPGITWTTTATTTGSLAAKKTTKTTVEVTPDLIKIWGAIGAAYRTTPLRTVSRAISTRPLALCSGPILILGAATAIGITRPARRTTLVV
jgi:hypothetical protein